MRPLACIDTVPAAFRLTSVRPPSECDVVLPWMRRNKLIVLGRCTPFWQSACKSQKQCRAGLHVDWMRVCARASKDGWEVVCVGFKLALRRDGARLRGKKGTQAAATSYPPGVQLARDARLRRARIGPSAAVIRWALESERATELARAPLPKPASDSDCGAGPIQSGPPRLVQLTSRSISEGAAASLSTVTGASAHPLLLIHARASPASYGRIHSTLRSSHRQ